MAAEQIADMNETLDGSGKDRPLRDDIRLLGRILGDTVREQEGEAVFDIVERIRQKSIRFHRDNDEAARHALEAILNDLSPGQTVQIVRAFSYFSHLANIAEDQHHIRRTRAHTLAGAAPRAGTIAHAIDRAQDAGIGAAELEAFFDEALVSPVLTAHPTEVRRKSTLDREMEIAERPGFEETRFECMTIKPKGEQDAARAHSRAFARAFKGVPAPILKLIAGCTVLIPHLCHPRT